MHFSPSPPQLLISLIPVTLLTYLVITFPKARLVRIYFTLVMSFSASGSGSQTNNRGAFIIIGLHSLRTSCQAGMEHRFHAKWKHENGFVLSYLAVFRADAHVFSTLIQADLIDLHRALSKVWKTGMVNALFKWRNHVLLDFPWDADKASNTCVGQQAEAIHQKHTMALRGGSINNLFLPATWNYRSGGESRSWTILLPSSTAMVSKI